MTSKADFLIERLRLQIEGNQLQEERRQLQEEKRLLQVERDLLIKQLRQMNALRLEMHKAFKHDRPIGTIQEVGRESLEFNFDGAGGTIYIVKYVDSSGTFFIYTEGFAENGDVAPKLFWLGYAVFFLVERLVQLGFKSVPDRFVKLCNQNPRFLGFIVREFQRIGEAEQGDKT